MSLIAFPKPGGCRLCGGPAGTTGLTEGVHPMCRLLQAALDTIDEVAPFVVDDAVCDEIFDELEAFAKRCEEPDVVTYTARTISSHIRIQRTMRRIIVGRRNRPKPPRRPKRDQSS
jgi:hypothetical protein